MAKTREERETVIRQSEADDTWTVFTEVGWLIRRMTRLFGPGIKKSEAGFEWRNVPQACVQVRKPTASSEETRAKATARLQAARAARSAQEQG